jgi:hypothetical protein
MLNPNASSTNLEAYALKDPVIGIYVAISPRDVTTK